MIINSATFSADRRYRYTLTRDWGVGNFRRLIVIGLNPSTADETQDDPTIRRLKAFALREGMGGFTMLNLFAFRATDPKAMKAEPHPVAHPDDRHQNDFSIVHAGAYDTGALWIAAWGVHGGYKGRDREVISMMSIRGVTIQCFGLTKEGYPKHPLYLPASSPLMPLPRSL